MGALHYLQVGCADATIILTSTATYLVDCAGIRDHHSLLPANKSIRGVFITHQHSDHYSGLSYLKEKGYAVDYLVCSPYERRYNDLSVTSEEWAEFKYLAEYFERKGTKIIAPYRQNSFEKCWWDDGDIKFWMIGPHKKLIQSSTREIHDASLVIKADLRDRSCCFTGDASDTCLAEIASDTTNYCNDILHASHHGSLNGAQSDFIEKANAGYTVISTESGIYDNVPHPTALQRYSNNTSNKVCRTDQGSIKFSL